MVALLLNDGRLILTATGWPIAVAYGLAFIVVLLRFCQQRWQRNETTYEYASALAVHELQMHDPASNESNESVSGSDGVSKPASTVTGSESPSKSKRNWFLLRTGRSR